MGRRLYWQAYVQDRIGREILYVLPRSFMSYSTSYRLGILLSIASGASAGIALIPYRIAMTLVPTATAIFLLLFTAAVMNTLFILPNLLRRQNKPTYHTSSWKITLWCGILLAFFSTIGNQAGGETIARLSSSVTCVLQQTQIIFAALAGWIWLREPVGWRFSIGTALALIGIGTMSSGSGDNSDLMFGIGLGLLSGLSFGCMQVVTRRYIANIDPITTNALRLWLAVVFFAAQPGVIDSLKEITMPALWYSTISAFGGPFLARTMLLYSARHIPAAQATLLGLSGPLFAVIAEWMVLHELPTNQQWLGGIIVMSGMVIAMFQVNSSKLFEKI
jgi:drug/metabolite transporter (DMT)-like permease